MREDIVGNIYNDLKVIKKHESDKKYEYNYDCQCLLCSNIFYTTKTRIIKGYAKKCPRCARKEALQKAINNLSFIKDLTGVKVGQLTVVSFAYVKAQVSWWKVKCDCGNEEIVRAAKLKQHYAACSKCIKKYVKEGVSKRRKGKTFANKQEIKCNSYKEIEDYIEGSTYNNKKFYFDKSDIQIIKLYTWRVNSSGYVVTQNADGKEIFLHNLIMGTTVNNVDHINGNRNGNRRCNLRLYDNRSENAANSKRRKDNSSGYTGITYLERLNKWQVSIQWKKQKYYIGVFANKEEAIYARKEAEKQFFGEFARKEIKD